MTKSRSTILGQLTAVFYMKFKKNQIKFCKSVLGYIYSIYLCIIVGSMPLCILLIFILQMFFSKPPIRKPFLMVPKKINHPSDPTTPLIHITSDMSLSKQNQIINVFLRRLDWLVIKLISPASQYLKLLSEVRTVRWMSAWLPGCHLTSRTFIL